MSSASTVTPSLTGRALFISPHFDDVALSCGGLVALESAHAAVLPLVVTVFAGNPPDRLNSFAAFQHERWATGDRTADIRRQEDVSAMVQLGADYRWLDWPDAVYRGDLYLSDEDLFGDVKVNDGAVMSAVSSDILAIVDETRPSRVYVPLAVGGHVDHRMCRRAAERMIERRMPVFLYEDLPYAVTPGVVGDAVHGGSNDLTPVTVDVSEGIERRLAAIDCYASQLPTIFRHYGDPHEVIRRYARTVAGSDTYAERLWIPAGADRKTSGPTSLLLQFKEFAQRFDRCK